MVDLLNGREFQLWEYFVSHGSLLIRSPPGSGFRTTIDIIFAGVEYISSPRHLKRISVSAVKDTEIQELGKILGKKVASHRVWVLQGLHMRAIIVAAHMKVREHQRGIFDSPFKKSNIATTASTTEVESPDDAPHERPRSPP